MEINVGRLCSPQRKTPLEKTNSLSGCTNVELRKQGHESDCEINGCKAEKLPENERNDHISSSDCAQRTINDLSSEGSQPLDKEIQGKMNWLNTGENGLKLVMQAVFPDKQCKTESSSSNSTQVILPSSSNDSYQETSLDIKSRKHRKTNAMDTFACTDFKSNLKESAFGSSLPAMVTHVPKAEPETTISLPGKLYNLVQASESPDSVRTRNADKVLGMTLDNNDVGHDLLKSDSFKKESVRLVNNGKADVFYDLDDALDMARRVAREVEQEVEVSGSSSSVQGRNSLTVPRSFVDSADSRRKSCLTENGSVSQQCDGQDKSVSVCSLKEKACSTKDMVIYKVNNSHGMQDLSYLTHKAESLTSNEHTSHHPNLDLNEDILEYEVDYPGQSVKEIVFNPVENVSKPTPAVAKSGISLCLPMSQVQKEEELGGWRGSAATSAFRSTAISRSCIRGKESSANDDNDNAKPSLVQGIDLNVAAIGVEFGSELLEEKSTPAQSSFPSNESSLEVSSTQARRFSFDLNCVSENDNSHQSPQSTSLSQHFTRDFDLNDKPSYAADAFVSSQPGQGTQTLKHRGLDSPAAFSMENSEQPDFRSFRSAFSTVSPLPGLGHGHAQPFLVAASNMLTSNEQMQRVAALQPKFSYTQPPPRAFVCNNGFCIDPNNSLPPALYAHGVIPYMMTDRHSTAIFPQVLGSGALSAFSRPQHVLQVPDGSGPSDFASARPNLDLYNGMNAVENRSRGGNARQLYIPSSNSVVEEQMKTFQPVAVSGPPMKRREPEGGWDSHQLSFRQVGPWR
ncbi:hypothetical protein FNV43_RR10614 [Rhamnella rubrinervis]|uniref:Uncharacterized protein n=1 Tax=Rhamnella rubrinervis TaxID=2594499 RepID=A0A8K0H4P8_9ROSA|nr:hypothetical protein FNV43_RR10614 [Rhamnella rubrinervis]